MSVEYPVVELEPQFSGDGAAPTPWSDAVEQLESRPPMSFDGAIGLILRT